MKITLCDSCGKPIDGHAVSPHRRIANLGDIDRVVTLNIEAFQATSFEDGGVSEARHMDLHPDCLTELAQIAINQYSPMKSPKKETP